MAGTRPITSGVLLVIEDDFATREYLCDASERELGIKVLQAENGRRALEILTTEHVDVILCDLNMPVMNGMSFFEKLRSQSVHTPVIFLTGYGEQTSQNKALGLGAYDFLPKPFKPEELFILLKDALTTSFKLQALPQKKNAG